MVELVWASIFLLLGHARLVVELVELCRFGSFDRLFSDWLSLDWLNGISEDHGWGHCEMC